jgi:protein-S-isoprenylcysteine O-methyltransferase Ste14
MAHVTGEAWGGPAKTGDAPFLQRLKTQAETWELAEHASRVLVAGLFLAFAYRIGVDFLETLRVTGLLLLASESLVVLLTVARRRAVVVDRSWDARLITAVTLVGPPLLRPGETTSIVPEALAASVLACGLLLVVAGKVSLGRSLGIVPANRGIVCRGVYKFVRHPIYAGYLVSHAAFLASHLDLWNASVLVVTDASLLVRAIYEERTLSRDQEYVNYQSRVRWRVLPGVF